MLDLIKDADFDLLIGGNDLVIGTSDQQHRNDLLVTEKGAIKQFVDAGVGAQTYLENEDRAGLLREVSLQFSADGMLVKKVGFNTDGKLLIEAPYL